MKMNTIKTIIIEDEINNLKLLEHFIDKYCPEIELIASCTSKTEAVKAIQKLKPQLLFLDVILEEHTAFDILEEVDYTNFNIIFVTAFEEYALKAFQYNAIDYLLKPIQIDDLIVAVKTGTGTSTITGTKWISKNVTNLRVVDSDNTLEITDGTLIISGVSTDTITITLPQANTFTAGSYYTIKRLDNGATPSSVSLLGDVSDTIEGGTNTFTITADKTAIVIQTDGINQWYILSNY